MRLEPRNPGIAAIAVNSASIAGLNKRDANCRQLYERTSAQLVEGLRRQQPVGDQQTRKPSPETVTRVCSCNCNLHKPSAIAVKARLLKNLCALLTKSSRFLHSRLPGQVCSVSERARTNSSRVSANVTLPQTLRSRNLLAHINNTTTTTTTTTSFQTRKHWPEEASNESVARPKTVTIPSALASFCASLFCSFREFACKLKVRNFALFNIALFCT